MYTCKMEEKTVLVTGGAGFIGSHVSERLLALGYHVVALDNFDGFYSKEQKLQNLQRISHPSFTFVEADIRADNLAELLAPYGPYLAVIHLAAKAGVLPSIREPELYNSVNIIGTQNILNWMKNTGVQRMVFASSSSVYGNSPLVPFREDQTPDQPISPYAFTKRACELMNYTWHHLHGLGILNLRFFTVYGPSQRPDLAIHKFVGKMLRNEPIPVYGDGSTARDYTFIADTVQGVVAALQHLEQHPHTFDILNLGNSHPVTLSQMIESLEQVLGRKAIIDRQPNQPGDVVQTYASIDRAQKLLGYSPSTTFVQGLEHFVAWYRAAAHA